MSCLVGYLEVDYTCIDFNVIISAAQRTRSKLYIGLLFPETCPFNRELVLALCGIYEASSRAHLDLQCEVLLPCSLDVLKCKPLPEAVFTTGDRTPHLKQKLVAEGSLSPTLQFVEIAPTACRACADQDRETSPKVAVGGTFDRLHAGHKVLLTTCAIYATEIVVVGLANGVLLKNKKFKELLEPFETRKNNIEEFLHHLNPALTPNIFCLEDVAGPTMTDPTITGLVASEESKANALWVNEQRKEKGWNELSLIIIGLVGNHPDLPADSNQKISSTGLREREWNKLQENKGKL